MEQNNIDENIDKDKNDTEDTKAKEEQDTVDSSENVEANTKNQNDKQDEKDISTNEDTNIDNQDEEETDELSNVKNQLVESEEKYKRLLAEFDNFRKRTEKEKQMMTDFGATLILTKVLGIVDNIERAVNNIPEDLKDNSYVDGIRKIYEQLMKTLEDLKVTPIKAKGEKFDQNLHNAVMTDEESDCEEGTITEELQKGFMYKDQVLRHSMVKVKK